MTVLLERMFKSPKIDTSFLLCVCPQRHLQFVWTHVFGDDKELVRSLGTHLWTGTDSMSASAADAKPHTLPLQQRFLDVRHLLGDARYVRQLKA